MEKTKWTKEKLEEMEKWKQDNGATMRATAEHFGESLPSYYGARSYLGMTPTKPRKMKPAKVLRLKRPKAPRLGTLGPVRKSAATGLSYVDLVHEDPAPTDERIAVVICPLNQLKKVIGGF